MYFSKTYSNLLEFNVDYYSYGMLMPGRHEQENTYEYGFNGMRKDDEIKDESGTSYDFGARMYDPRVGRWLKLDNVSQPERSPYAGMHNNPILLLDPDGNDIVIGAWRQEDRDKFVAELTGITGLNLFIDNNNRLQIAPGPPTLSKIFSAKGVEISSTAATDLTAMINDPCTWTHVSGVRGEGSYFNTTTSGDDGNGIFQGYINVDPEESELFLANGIYQKRSTMSTTSENTLQIAGTTGIKFFHETAHENGAFDEIDIGTPTGDPRYGDDRAAGGIIAGSAASYENSILAEMGLFIRATYFIRMDEYKIVPYVQASKPASSVINVLNNFKSGNFDKFPKTIDFLKMPYKEDSSDTQRNYEEYPLDTGD